MEKELKSGDDVYVTVQTSSTTKNENKNNNNNNKNKNKNTDTTSTSTSTSTPSSSSSPSSAITRSTTTTKAAALATTEEEETIDASKIIRWAKQSLDEADQFVKKGNYRVSGYPPLLLLLLPSLLLYLHIYFFPHYSDG